MLFFKPERLDKEDKNIRFDALENDEKIGMCLMKIDDNFCDVYELTFDSDKPYVVEGLLRSAYNYASLRNIYIGKCTAKGIDKFLNNMNFEKTENSYENDIPSILMGSCCKDK